MNKTYDLVAVLKETEVWEQLWDGFEYRLAEEFLSTNDPLTLHNRLQSCRELRTYMESIK